MRSIVFIAFLSFCRLLNGQLSNELLNLSPKLPFKPTVVSFEAFPFLKNNEYFNAIHPGETIFGFRSAAAGHFLLKSNNARLTLGALIQQEYGDSRSRLMPLMTLELISKSDWHYHFGALVSGTRHGMLDAMYDYENALKQPLEYGIQARKMSEKLFFDGWIEWRSKLRPEIRQREMIIAGLNADMTLLKAGNLKLSLPLQATIVHQGGQVVQNPLPVVTRLNAAAGIRFGTADTGVLLESYYLQSLDNSPNPSQPWVNGWASMTNFRVRFARYHHLALSWWYGREFTTTVGSPVFSGVNTNYVYAHAHTRPLAMARYVFARPVIGSHIWIDVRVEPFYDVSASRFEFSHGLFLKYVTAGSLRIPRLF